MIETLGARVAAMLAAPVAPQISAWAASLGEEAGALAVLFYGSNLRTCSLEGVLDFYVLLPGPSERGIWPRVGYRERVANGQELRAKIANMALSTFAEAAAGNRLDTTIWARFTQPCALLWTRGPADGAAVTAAVCAATTTAARLAVALGPPQGEAEAYWRALFRATYAAEFRFEAPGRENAILSANAAHFNGLLPPALDAAGIGFVRDGAAIRPLLPPAERRQVLHWWRKRRRTGKLHNLVRLLRASLTFDGAARYAAWKIERHTGVPVPLTPWRERHPVLAAPGVLWRLWRTRRRKGA